MSASVDVVVLGAGPAGLGAALRLARSGRSVVVLERADRVGGLAGSIEVGGQRVDVGSHRLHPATDPEVLALLRGLLGEDLQVRRRDGRIRLFDRWLGFPLRPGDIARSLPPGFLARAGASALVASLRPTRDRTFADVVTTGLGRVMGQEFYFPYARKVWGLPPEELAGEVARRRIRAGSPARLVRTVLAPRKPASGEPGTFLYPAGGFGRISEALAAAAVAAGVELRLGRSVERVGTGQPGADTGSATVTASTRDGRGERVEAGTVLSTVPLPALAAALDPAPVAPLPALASRAMLVVYLVLDVRQWTPFDAHYLPGPWTPLTRVSEPRNYRTPTARWPDPDGTTVVCAELPCDPDEAGDDAPWGADDATLTALVLEAFERSGLPQPRVLDTVVLRRRHAYPVHRVGDGAALAAVLDEVEARPRLVSFGRQGLFAHDNTHHALAMAVAAADAVGPDGRLDRASWARARTGFAAHVVED